MSESGKRGRGSMAEPAEEQQRVAELASALDVLGDKVKLLVERSRQLSERCREEEDLRRRLEGGLDPVALDERVHELESENDRLVRHAQFLEQKLKELLSRVRYVVEG